MLSPFDSLMLRMMLPPLVAVIQLFAVYVLLNGHYGPGGGFVAGILVAAGMILPRLGGPEPASYWLTARGAAVMAVAGILWFAAVASAPLLVGHAPLDYAALPIGETAAARRYLGILLIEVGITLAVAGAMLAIFYALGDDYTGDEAARD
jgi:multicomponent Na+:H+ antiporter subunit B